MEFEIVHQLFVTANSDDSDSDSGLATGGRERISGGSADDSGQQRFKFVGADPARVVDADGNTLIHWAAVLGCSDETQALATHVDGSVPLINYKGETPLMRCVMSQAAYERQNMDTFLTLFGDTLQVRDLHGRSVLHHIALSAGIRGRLCAARNYMSCVLRHVSLIPDTSDISNQCNVSLDSTSIINASDSFGDTPLIISARIGDTPMIELLANAGADVNIRNNAGLCARDFGVAAYLLQGGRQKLIAALNTTSGNIKLETLETASPIDTGVVLNHACLDSPPLSNGKSRGIPSSEIHRIPDPLGSRQFSDALIATSQTIEQSLQTLHEQFSTNITANMSLLQSTQIETQELHRTCAALRKRNALLQSKAVALEEQAANCRKARVKRTLETNKETKRCKRMRKVVEELTVAGVPCEDSRAVASNPDHPKDTRKMDIHVQLDTLNDFLARKEAEKQQLLRDIAAVEDLPKHHEELCKMIFSACCSVPLDEVSASLLEPVLGWLDKTADDQTAE
ncbi:ankyrin repeat-containing domain protein [Chytriomyces cf. hyalinus JEL632]|nr:ankyrin repeat-containing domain protein [Chytriomyces cf. hyalinus JEL632]